MNQSDKCGLSAIIDYLEVMNQYMQPSFYAVPLPVLNGASIGQHVRHIHDFYKALALGFRDNKIDYNLRERNAVIEISLEMALTELHDLNQFFSELDKTTALFIVSSEGFDELTCEIPSVLQRELMYAYDHAIHHLAFIRIGFESVHDVYLPTSFGVARSTLSHHKK